MGFRLSCALTLFLMLCDLSLLSARASVNSGAVVYVLLALHEAVLLALAFLLGSFVSYTRWAMVGPLSDALRLLRVVIPLWLLRVIFTFLTTWYRTAVLQPHRAWSDVWYGIFFGLNIIFFIAFHMALLHAICFLSEKTLYTPYCSNNPPPNTFTTAVGGTNGGGSECYSNPLQRPGSDNVTSHPCDVSSTSAMRTSHMWDKRRSSNAASHALRRT